MLPGFATPIQTSTNRRNHIVKTKTLALDKLSAIAISSASFMLSLTILWIPLIKPPMYFLIMIPQNIRPAKTISLAPTQGFASS
ncbi:uncharacterized protein METZ01_LOCUS420523, partial [marine metagenome]